MSEDMPSAEGCYRLEGGDWQVVIAFKTKGIHPVGVRNGLRWDSGVTGMNIVLWDDATINKSSLMRIMSEALGIDDWREVSGPDSMNLR